MANNPRIDDLRKRLEKEPNSRLFAQLAEELRKDGEFEEAIRIARAGLARHPSYPSARMTLGRALFDTGDMAAARIELQSVLEGAPDNILASRLLAECLESLGDLEGALQRYRATLALSPGDKQLTQRIRDIEGRLHASPPAAPLRAAEAVPADPSAPSEAPIPLAAVDEPMELETTPERLAAPAAPVPVAEAPAEFELEKAYEAPGTEWRQAEAADATAEVAPAGGGAAEAEIGERTLVDEPAPVPESSAAPAPQAEALAPAEPPAAATPVAAEPSFEYTFEPATPASPVPDVPAAAEPTAPPTAFEPVPPPEALASAAVPEAAPAPTGSDEPEIASPTLAELYFNQGFPEKAREVYRRLLEREPGNERARARLLELQQTSAAPEAAEPATEPTAEAPAETPAEAPMEAPMEAPASAGDGAAEREVRRQALERTIDRLESLRAVLQRGTR